MVKIIILGAAGFIGTNLAKELSKCSDNVITLVDVKREYFEMVEKQNLNVLIRESPISEDTDFDLLLKEQDVVYHLVSTTTPTTSNQYVAEELKANVVVTAKILDACVRTQVKKVVFLSSGGTVYGKKTNCPLKEDMETNPITSYGIQKVTIEKLLYLYWSLYGLDYRIIRLANPYGPYQRPNGMLGVVSTFTYKALKKEELTVYGDGSVVRDFIYIDDAIRGILNIANGKSSYKTFNLGSGFGTSVKQVVEEIQKVLGIPVKVTYEEGRKVDVPVNFLDIKRYEEEYGPLLPISLYEGIGKTAEFMRSYYRL